MVNQRRSLRRREELKLKLELRLESKEEIFQRRLTLRRERCRCGYLGLPNSSIARVFLRLEELGFSHLLLRAVLLVLEDEALLQQQVLLQHLQKLRLFQGLSRRSGVSSETSLKESLQLPHQLHHWSGARFDERLLVYGLVLVLRKSRRSRRRRCRRVLKTEER